MTSFTNKIALCIVLLIILGSSFSCKLKKQTTTSEAGKERIQLQYIPKLLHGTYLGMPFADFSKIIMVMPEKDSSQSDFRIVFIETIEDNDIRKVTYYFDKDNNQPLYQYIIEYNSYPKLQELIQQKYGNKNDGSQWIFDSGEGFMISVWTFEKTLCIAGLIEGTEWDK
jgi:hypothetical protein